MHKYNTKNILRNNFKCEANINNDNSLSLKQMLTILARHKIYNETDDDFDNWVKKNKIDKHKMWNDVIYLKFNFDDIGEQTIYGFHSLENAYAFKLFVKNWDTIKNLPDYNSVKIGKDGYGCMAYIDYRYKIDIAIENIFDIYISDDKRETLCYFCPKNEEYGYSYVSCYETCEYDVDWDTKHNIELCYQLIQLHYLFQHSDKVYL